METSLSLEKEITSLNELLSLESKPVDNTIESQLKYITDSLLSNQDQENWNKPAVQPILMKMILVLEHKQFTSLNKHRLRLKNGIKMCLRDFLNKSKLAPKFLKQLNLFFSKKKFSKFPNCVGFLGELEEFRACFQKSIQKECQKNLDSLEKENKSISAGFFNYLEPEFICGKMIPFLGKILRKSMKNLSKTRIWIKELSKWDRKHNMDSMTNLTMILQANMHSALDKDQSFQKDFFFISSTILDNLSPFYHGNEKVQSVVAEFLSKCISKLNSKRNDPLMLEFAKMLLMIKGVQSKAVIKQIVDGLWMAYNNLKGDPSKGELKRLLPLLQNIGNLKDLLNCLSSKIKDKKDIMLSGCILEALTAKFELSSINLKKINNRAVICFDKKIFNLQESCSFVEFTKSVRGDLTCHLGKKSREILTNTPENCQLSLINVHSLIHNSYYSLFSENEDIETSQEEIDNANKNTSLENIIELSKTWKSEYQLDSSVIEKILKLLFRSNSLLFRKSLVDSLSSADCLTLLKLLSLLGESLKDHLRAKKLENLTGLLLATLLDKLLQSKYCSRLYNRGRISKLINDFAKRKQLGLLGTLLRTLKGPQVLSPVLLDEYLTSLLLRGMFSQMVGKRYCLSQHLKFKRIFHYLKKEKINIFKITRKFDETSSSSISLSLKVAFLISNSEFDHSQLGELDSWMAVVVPFQQNSKEELLEVLNGNSSRLNNEENQKGLFLGNLDQILGSDEEKKAAFIERICTANALFSQNFTTRNFFSKLLSYFTLFDSKMILQRLNWLIKEPNLSKLTRMKKILHSISLTNLEFESFEQVQPYWLSENLTFALEGLQDPCIEMENLKNYGYSDVENLVQRIRELGYPSVSEFQEERTSLFELCHELTLIKENEDESIAELELNNKKQSLIQSYSDLLDRLAEYFGQIVRDFKSLGVEGKARMTRDCISLQESLKTNIDSPSSYISGRIEKLFLNVYTLACQQDNMPQLITFYYQILMGNEESEFIQYLEKQIEKLELKEEYVSNHLFPIFFTLLEFLVQENLSANAKKQSLSVVFGFLEKFDEYTIPIYSFLVNNLNSLYFESAFENIESLLLSQLEKASKNFVYLV